MTTTAKELVTLAAMSIKIITNLQDLKNKIVAKLSVSIAVIQRPGKVMLWIKSIDHVSIYALTVDTNTRFKVITLLTLD